MTMHAPRKSDRAQHAEELDHLAHQIAEALTIGSGAAWTHRPPEDDGMGYHTAIHGLHGQILHLERGHPGRLEIVGWFEAVRDYHDRDNRHAMTVSIHRRPVEIAGEIRRRLVPAYSASLAAAYAAKAIWEAKVAQQTALAAALCAETQGQYHQDSTHRFYVQSEGGHPERRTCAQVNVTTDSSVWMDLNGLTAAQARAILTIVLGWPTAAQTDPVDAATMR